MKRRDPSWVFQGAKKFGGDAEEAEALVCKTSLSGFESRRHLQVFIALFRLIGPPVNLALTPRPFRVSVYQVFPDVPT